MGLDISVIGAAAAADWTPMGADSTTTLAQSILQRSTGHLNYRTLRAGPGEPHIARLDLLRKSPGSAPTTARRSLLYLAHLSDMHVIDAQSPGRIEPMIVQDHAAWGSAFHPQDPLTVHVTAAMVQSFADNRSSPVTGGADWRGHCHRRQCR